MDVKKLIDQVVDFVSNNKDAKALFEKNPIKVVEQALKIDLPDDIVNKIVSGVKAKISLDQLGDAANTLKGLFGK